MRTTLLVSGIALFALFLATLIATPFAWRLGSRPAVTQWLRFNLPSWLLLRLEKKEKNDHDLCLRLVLWFRKVTWITYAGFLLVAFVLMVTGVA